MAVQRGARAKSDNSGRQGWSLRHYMALFMVVLLAVAALAAFAVRTMAEQDASTSAKADATFAAERAAALLKAGFDQIQEVSSPLVADPAIGQLWCRAKSNRQRDD